jgi:Mce-associated membrane protein
VTAATDRVRRPSRRTVTLGALVVTVLALVAALVVVAVKAPGVLGRREAEERRGEVLQEAKQHAVNFTTLDYRTFDDDIELVLDGATGSFREEFSGGVEQVRDLVTQNESVSKGSVSEAGLVSVDDDSARVLVVADTEVSNLASPDPQPRHYRIHMDLTRTGDRWLVSDLTFVSSSIDGPAPPATPVPIAPAPTEPAPTPTGGTP